MSAGIGGREDAMDSIINGHRTDYIHDVFSAIVHSFINIKSVASIKARTLFPSASAMIMI
jgi:hypothetical protein